MPTQQKTDTSNKYDPGSMNAFQSMTPGFAKTTNDYMTNPFGNPFMQQQQQMGTRQAQNLGGAQMSNISRNITGSGMGGGNMSPAALEMMQNQGRANSGMQAQMGFMQPMQNAQGMQQFAMGQAGGYRPLQTGGTQTQSTSGLGTWLPQLAGAAMGGLTGGFGGMMGGHGGGGGGHAPSMGSGFYSGATSSPFGGGGMGGANPGWMGGMAPPGMNQGFGGGGGPMNPAMGNSWWPGMQ